MRLTRAEKKAAAAVLTVAAAVTVSGIRLLRRHTRYVVQKAAAHFSGEDAKGEAAGETVDGVEAETEA